MDEDSAGDVRGIELLMKPLIDGEQIRWIGPVNQAQKQELLRNAAALLFRSSGRSRSGW